LLADVAILITAKVLDLKAAVMKYTDSMEQIQMGHGHISCPSPFALDASLPCLLVQRQAEKLKRNWKITLFCKLALLHLELSTLLTSFD
jgi:hypothetical protein